MGCPVNGPGEARHADFGIAGAIKEGYIFKKGEIIARVPEADLINSLEKIDVKEINLDNTREFNTDIFNYEQSVNNLKQLDNDYESKKRFTPDDL